jgi:hypothetical protein
MKRYLIPACILAGTIAYASAPTQPAMCSPPVVVKVPQWINFIRARHDMKAKFHNKTLIDKVSDEARPCALARRVRSVVDGKCYFPSRLPEGASQ